jgi:NADPH:quinone reductase-like Zn-dependent oxidoreductase
MKAIVQTRYGSPDVLQLKDVEKLVVKDDEVLVRVHAAAVNIGDWHLLRGVPYGRIWVVGWGSGGSLRRCWYRRSWGSGCGCSS